MMFEWGDAQKENRCRQAEPRSSGGREQETRGARMMGLSWLSFVGFHIYQNHGLPTMAGLAFFCHLLLMEKMKPKVLGCAEIITNPQWRMRPHSHPFHEIIVVKSGSMLLKTRHGDLVARVGDILFYEAGMVHEEISTPEDPVRTVFLAFQSGQILPALPLRAQDYQGRVRELLDWMRRDQQEGRCAEDCHLLLDMILREMHWLLARPKDAWLETIRTQMKVRLQQHLSLDDVAGLAGMSRFAFVRKFKRLSGCTPMEELRKIRLNEARNLILSSDLPMKIVAEKVGIGDEYQFSKQFRRQFGTPPSRLRNRPSTG
jgi:AraC-like DNA-binding protein/mannose-6-phosphate isomerase-like protein (cupin superfamily)